MRAMFTGMLCLFLAGMGSGFGQEKRIAVVNFRKVVTEHPKAAELEKELREVSEKANKVLQSKDEELLNLEEKIRRVSKEGKQEDGSMEASAARELLSLQQKSLQVQENAVQVRAQVSAAISQRRKQELPKIAAEILEYVRAANDGKYAIVLDSSSLSPEGFPQVLDHPGAVDLTSEVIELLPEQ